MVSTPVRSFVPIPFHSTGAIHKRMVLSVGAQLVWSVNCPLERLTVSCCTFPFAHPSPFAPFFVFHSYFFAFFSTEISRVRLVRLCDGFFIFQLVFPFLYVLWNPPLAGQSEIFLFQTASSRDLCFGPDL